MIKINLLPHREEKRKQRKYDFYTLMALAVIIGVVLIIAVGVINATEILVQDQRNHLIKAENDKLDEEIKEIATLRDEIDGLKARQQAVEDLQGDRNQPVYLLSELVAQTPEGIYLRSVKQDGQNVILMGYAQSNERVSEYLKNLSSHSDWLDNPKLIVINAAGIGQGRAAKKVFDFTINVAVQRPRDREAAAAALLAAGGAPAAGAPAVPGVSGANPAGMPPQVAPKTVPVKP